MKGGSRVPRGFLVLAVGALVVLPALAAPAAGLSLGGLLTPTKANAIVGFETRAVDVQLLKTLGATVIATSSTLGLAAVYVSNIALFTALAEPLLPIAWVEANDATRATSSSWDASGWDASGWDSSSWDASGWDASGWDSSSWDASGWDASGWDASGWDASGWDASGWDASGWDASGWDASGWDASGWDASGWDASGWDGGRITTIGKTKGAAGTDPLVPYQWGLAAVNASAAAVRSASGATIVCVLDSGVDASHPDLAGRVLPGYDHVNKDTDARDDAGHGTHVAGIAAAVTGNGIGLAGMANVKILPVKVLAANGVGQEIDLAFGIKTCQERGADVISMSLGTPEKSKAIHRAVVDAFAAGIVLVASVGNQGTTCNCTQYPAAYPQVVSVGAVSPGGKRASFSSVTDGVDFAAPGYAIVSTLPGGKYGTMNGTSMAVPYVSALAAHLLDRGLNGPETMRAIKETATDLGPAGKDPYVGFGVVNYGAALSRS